MADSVTLQFRGIYLEDFGTSPTPAQVTTTILGLGDGIDVTPLVAAADDTAATNAGLGIGDVYIANGSVPNKLRANGGSSGGAATKLIGSASINVGLILDGTTIALVTTITVTGALVGDPVTIGVNPPLDTGVWTQGKVTATNTVTVEVQNNSTFNKTPGSATYTATIVH